MVLLESLKVPLGSEAHDFSLKGLDNKVHSLKDFAAAKVLVMVFTCNHCPYAKALWPRIIALAEKYKDRSVQFVAINPNINPEFPEDSFEKMQEYARILGIFFPYLEDATQQVAKTYKAQCTPDIYVYDAQRKLAYHGRVDDNWKEPEKAAKHELDDALAAMVEGKSPSADQHPSMGCSIKWVV